MKWRYAKIEEIASVKGGKRLPKGHAFISKPTEHLYIRARDIGNNRITLTDGVYLTDETYRKIGNYTVSANDLVVTIVGANIGDVAFITNEYNGANLTENAARIRVNEDVCDPRFLSFQISTHCAKEKFQLLTGGSAQGKLGLYKINSFNVVLPPISVQKRIASILSAYDDLIENNRRRIQLLEQSARLLYKEWFVNFRFPGHEHTKIIDGMPEGWERKALNEIADITMGQSPKSIYYNKEGNGLPFHQGVTNFGNRFPSHETYCTVQNRLAVPGDILFSVRAPVGRINITKDKIVIGRGIAAIRSNRNQQNFLFYSLKSHFFKEDMMGGGAIFAAITKKNLHEFMFLQPSDSLVDVFMKHALPIDFQIAKLYQTVEWLSEARDFLLPKLMRGEIEV